MQYIEAQDILDATNGGLDIILLLYPDAVLSKDNRNRKFKVREEKTPSASLIQHNIAKHGDTNWVVTDFGSDQKPRNGILCWMQEKGLSYPDALQDLAARFNVVSPEKAAEIFKATYSDRPAEPDEEEGTWSWDIRDKWNDSEIETILSKNTLKYLAWKSTKAENAERAKDAYSKIAAAFKLYHWHPLVSYSLVKNRKVMTFSSTEQYPIFLIDEGTHQKIYQPKHPDKGKRFMYHGKKPKDFIHGLEQITKAFNKRKAEIEAGTNETNENKDRTGDNSETPKSDTDPKLNAVFLLSGGSDAINAALLNIQIKKKDDTAVIWLNSETATLQQSDYNELMKMTKALYQLQDIDPTGKKAAHNLSMQYLDIFNVELPEELKRYRDSRGNPCKDLRDYLNHYKRSDFKLLIDSALPYRFWEKKPRYEGRGDNRVFAGFEYEFDNVQAYNFLQKVGFYRLPVGDKDGEWEYIHINGNTVTKTDPVKIKNYIKNFLKERYLDKELKNAMFRTTQLSDNSLTNLDELLIDFTDYDKTTQFLFFKNTTLKITAAEIKEFKPGAIDRYTWEEEILDHRFELLSEPFTITRDSLNAYDIKINDQDSYFLKYLIQTSRVHWRAELEGERMDALPPDQRDKYKKDHQYTIDGPNLLPEEIDEQKQHLINKIFTIGYLLHRYKDRSRPWFVYAMDNRVNDDGRSHGGSGKSILFDTCMTTMLKKHLFINGRLPKVMEDTHKYDGLTEHDRYIVIEDANEYFRLDILFNDVSGNLKVNPKGKKPFTIPFDKAPKIAVTTNYTARNLDSSTIRRMLYYVCSDYYHTAGETNDYKETRDPRTEFGLNLIVDFDQNQFNHFYNVMAYCLKFYLSCTEKIGPAMNNVTRRQLKATMGEGFEDWANVFFSEESGNLNKMVPRPDVFANCQEALGKLTPQVFMEKLRAFCRLNEYVLNPKRFLGKKGNIIKKAEKRKLDQESGQWIPTGQLVTAEMIYIETVDNIPNEVQPPEDKFRNDPPIDEYFDDINSPE